jgi:hypothetical protein
MGLGHRGRDLEWYAQPRGCAQAASGKGGRVLCAGNGFQHKSRIPASARAAQETNQQSLAAALRSLRCGGNCGVVEFCRLRIDDHRAAQIANARPMEVETACSSPP